MEADRIIGKVCEQLYRWGLVGEGEAGFFGPVARAAANALGRNNRGRTQVGFVDQEDELSEFEISKIYREWQAKQRDENFRIWGTKGSDKRGWNNFRRQRYPRLDLRANGPGALTRQKMQEIAESLMCHELDRPREDDEPLYGGFTDLPERAGGRLHEGSSGDLPLQPRAQRALPKIGIVRKSTVKK